MEITKTNFQEKLSEISKDIEQCTFLSFDGEFSGLSLENNIYQFNTPEEIYHKHLKNSSNFILVQLGLSLFQIVPDPEDTETIDEEDESFQKVEKAKDDDMISDEKNKKLRIVCKTYNFYCYPQHKNANFMVQSESFTFLANNGFDFNKLFKQGLSYCNSAEEKKLRDDLKDRQTQRLESLKNRAGNDSSMTTNYITVPDCEKIFLNGIDEQISKYLEANGTELEISSCNGFQRRLVYEMIEQKYSDKVSTFSRNIDNNRKAIVVVKKRTEEEEQKVEEKRQETEEKNLLDMIGLSLVLREISKSKKLIIGHNMILDVIYIIRQFFEPLPEDYGKFKILTHKIFPNLIDTKFVSTAANYKDVFKSTVLQYLCQKVLEPPFEETKIEWENPYHSYSLKDSKEHEAGYDAFITGHLFISLMKFIHLDLNELNLELYKCSKIRPFLNRISLQCGLIPYIYLIGKEPTETRDHVFHIKFSPTWRVSDIQEHFKNYGPIFISWINSSSAFIELKNRDNFPAVMKTIHKPSGFEIMTLKQFFHLTSEPNVAALERSGKKRRGHSESWDDLGDKREKHHSHKKSRKAFKDDDSW